MFDEGPDKVTPGTKMPIQKMKNNFLLHIKVNKKKQTSRYKVLKNDEINKLLFGDSGSATAIQKKENQSIHFVLGSDGRGSDKLMIRQSGFRGKKGKPYFFMDGKEVFYLIRCIND